MLRLREVDEYTQGWRDGQWGTVEYPDPRRMNKKPKLNHTIYEESWDPEHIRELPGQIQYENPGGANNGPPTPCTWVEEGYIFVGFNTSQLKVPPRVLDCGPRSVYEMGLIEWEQSGLPYLPYLSIEEKFDGRLLRRLAIDKNRFPIHTSASGLITLDKKLVDAWVRLETNFRRLIDIYKQRTKFHDIKFLPLPQSHKLYSEYSDKGKLIQDAFATRNRFLVLCATLSFFVSIRRGWARYEHRLDPSSPGDIQRWLQFQAEPIAAGVHPQWVTMILDSSIVWGRKGVKRRGVFIDYRKSEFSVLVPHMIDYGVPVVLRIEESSILKGVDLIHQDRILNTYRRIGYPDITVDGMNALLRKYVPPPDVISHDRERPSAKQITNVFSFENHNAARQPDSGPTSWRAASSSRPHETIIVDGEARAPKTAAVVIETRVEFLARRDQEREAAIQGEGETARRLRLNRENGTKDFQMPGRKQRLKTKVFFWESDGASEIRKLVDPGEYDSLWEQFDHSEMHYDSVRDEWDIWNSRRPKCGFRPAGIDEDEEIAADQLIDGDIALAPDFDKDLFREELLYRLDLNLERSDGHYVEATRITDVLPLMDRMAVWYGYVRHTKLSKWDCVKIPNKLDPQRLRHALHDSITEVNTKQLTGIQQFFASLIVRKNLPPPSHDTSGASISSFGNPCIVVRRSPNKAKEFDDPKSPLITLYSVEVIDDHGRPKPDRKDRRLFVWNAIIALAVKRFQINKFQNLEHIAEILLEHGVPYILAIPRVRLARPRFDDRVAGLGTWTSDIKENDPLDFKAYLMKIRELFSILRLRKCLRYGGIIWRLARLHLDIYDGLDGPSIEALNEPQRLEGPGDLVDDGLSKTELEMLIGTFEVVKHLGGKEPVRYSYWPPPYIWSSKGHNVGPWSPDNEDWFTQRFQLYMSGKAQLYTVDEWRTRAGGFTETKVMMNSLEEVSKKFIDS